MTFLMLARRSHVPSRLRRIGLFRMFPFRIREGTAEMFTVEDFLDEGSRSDIIVAISNRGVGGGGGERSGC